MAGWPPQKDFEFGAYLSDFSAKITATPTAFGLTASEATLLSTVTTAYNSALNVATDEATRTKATVGAKNTAKAVAMAELRSLAKRVQANDSISVEQRLLLGLPIHDVSPSVIGAPVTRPLLSTLGIGLGELQLHLVDETTPNKKAHVAGVLGAQIYAVAVPAGSPAPAALTADDLSDGWEHKGFATRSTFTVSWDAADNGKTGYIAAVWMSRRGETGPVSIPISVPIAA